jgi:hypothetical protein
VKNITSKPYLEYCLIDKSSRYYQSILSQLQRPIGTGTGLGYWPSVSRDGQHANHGDEEHAEAHRDGVVQRC